MGVLAALNPGVVEVWVAFVLTLMVFSYLVRDNPLYRLAEHLFVGTAAGYVVVVAYHGVLRPRLFDPLLTEPWERWQLLIPLLLGLLLLAKSRRSTAWLGNTAMGLLFGVGAALAVGGALLGTIIPQTSATWLSLNPGAYGTVGWAGVVNAGLIVVGTAGALLYFHFKAPAEKRIDKLPGLLRTAWGRAGYWFILISLGAVFGNTVLARMSLLIGRVRFLLESLGLLGG